MPLRDTIDASPDTRPCAVAGRFYPSEPDVLQRDVTRYLNDAAASDAPPRWKLRGVIAPHAGYPYSAPIAASAYRWVEAMAGQITRVVLIGPAHYLAFDGLGCSSAYAFDCPLGPVPVDTDAVRRLLNHPDVHLQDEAHAPEHGLEVHLPFLIHTLRGAGGTPGFSIVPILFGNTGHEATAEVLAPFFDDPRTLVVISSDLSHYHDATTAGRLDRQTADAILAGRGEALVSDRACGHTAIRAAMQCTATRGLHLRLLDLRHSGDTAGPSDRVVGYGAFVIGGPR